MNGLLKRIVSGMVCVLIVGMVGGAMSGCGTASKLATASETTPADSFDLIVTDAGEVSFKKNGQPITAYTGTYRVRLTFTWAAHDLDGILIGGSTSISNGEAFTMQLQDSQGLLSSSSAGEFRFMSNKTCTILFEVIDPSNGDASVIPSKTYTLTYNSTNGAAGTTIQLN